MYDFPPAPSSYDYDPFEYEDDYYTEIGACESLGDNEVIGIENEDWYDKDWDKSK